MAFCAICGSHHDPDVPCGNSAEQILRSAGINKSRKMSKRKSQKTAIDVDKVIKMLFLIAFVLLIVYLLYTLFRPGM
jgi:uncharacterized membrane protein YvbJ